jgi:hypothetical protein
MQFNFTSSALPVTKHTYVITLHVPQPRPALVKGTLVQATFVKREPLCRHLVNREPSYDAVKCHMHAIKTCQDGTLQPSTPARNEPECRQHLNLLRRQHLLRWMPGPPASGKTRTYRDHPNAARPLALAFPFSMIVDLC